MRVVPHEAEKPIIVRLYTSPYQIRKKSFKIGPSTYYLTDNALRGVAGWWVRRDDNILIFGVVNSTYANESAIMACAAIDSSINKLSKDELQNAVDFAMTLIWLMQYHGYIAEEYGRYKRIICNILEKNRVHFEEINAKDDGRW